MPQNAVRIFEASNDGGKLIVEATTWLLAAPTLLTFCCPYRLIPKTRKRGGETVPHGNLLYLDCIPKRFAPTGPSGPLEFRWEVPNPSYLPCKDCHLAIVEFGLAHPLDWTTQVHPCPPVPVAAVHFDGAAFLSTGALIAPPSPLLTASFWYRSFSDQSGAVTWISDPADTASNDEFLGSVNSPAFISSENPYPSSDGGQFQFAANINASFGEWHHVCYSVNTGNPAPGKAGIMYIDRVPVGQVDRDLGEGYPINIDGLPFFYGGSGYPFGQTLFDVYDLWIAVGQAVDFTDSAELDKFVTPDLKPVPLGDHGELPTGVAPTIFGHGGAASFLQPNLGTGGGFALSGTLTDTTGPA